MIDKNTGKVIQFDKPIALKGGTYAIGGTTEAWLNVTYNYSQIFYRVMGERGIRTIYGLKGKEAALILEEAIKQLKNDVADDYWEPTEGNAQVALRNLLQLAYMCPDGIFAGD
jgi:hypothetical protein